MAELSVLSLWIGVAVPAVPLFRSGHVEAAVSLLIAGVSGIAVQLRQLLR